MAGELFRKSAVEKLSSPEQLDVMMQVTSPKGWVALTGVSILWMTSNGEGPRLQSGTHNPDHR